MNGPASTNLGKLASGPSVWLVRTLFCLLLMVHLFLVTRNWGSGWLIGLEFRQTQTAISAHFIQQENNFSLAYPTPVLGKPWSIPMEFPLYQWSTVWLSNATGWSLTSCARTLSALSFYATLPALFLLLGRLGVPPVRRLLVLAVVLSSPLYIFYSRAFLIEAMALAFSAWFLAAFVQTMDRRSWPWLAATVLCGTGAALVKITTFILWCVPAVAYGAWWLGRDWSAASGVSRRWGATLAWGLTCSVPVLAAAWWWVRVSDAIKRLNPAGADLVSSRLASYNFGGWAARFSPEIWGRLFHQWHVAVLPLWLAVPVALLAVFLPRAHRWPAGLALGLFFAAQLIFPLLYSIHDYYFYAAGVFLLCAAGCVLAGLLDSRLPRPLVWLAALALVLSNLNTYRTGYYETQRIPSVGGTGLTDALRNTSPPDSVLVIVGDDWDSRIPYYSQRRALMIRRDLEASQSYQARAFADLRGEDVFALVVVGPQRANRDLIVRATGFFHLDPEVTFRFEDTADVYVRRWHRNRVLRQMGSNEHPFYNHVRLVGRPDAPEGAPAEDAIEHLVHASDHRKFFSRMTPVPSRYNFMFGLQAFDLEGRPMLGAHPPSALWFIPPPGAHRILCEFGILPGAYADPNNHTDGAEFSITEKLADGTERTVYRRRLDPVGNPADRGLQQVTVPYAPAPGAELNFATGFAGSSAFDWCYWGKIRIE